MKTQKFRLSRIVMNFLLLVYAVFAIFPLIWMLLSFPFGITAQLFRGWRWKQSLEPLGEKHAHM